ncbi:MAG: hypothetical protein WB809_08405 [Thermoplasmata archaeon]
MISARLGGAGDLHLFAPVRGLASEVPLLLAALEAAPPSVVGLGISPDELRGLLDYFVNATAEPVVPLTTAERSEVRGLVRFGEVRVPNPAFVELLRWAREIPVEALDPTEDRTANLFADHIGYVELVRRTVRERRVSRTPPAPPSPDEYALAWDRTVAGGRGSRNFATARDRHLVRAALLLANRHARVAVVVDRERFESVKTLFAAPDPGRLDPD